MMRKLIFLALFSFLISSCMTVPGVPKNTVMLGERTVTFKADHDVIPVGAYEGSFKSLFFVVEKNDIQIFNLVVIYGNGERQRFDTRLNFNADSRSRYLAFTGGKRRIRTIAFNYRTAGTWVGGRARVVVYGVR
jgi:predicted small secreted protein